ncbi:MAG: DUF885 domain-containing protein [Ekhidna sp.]|uniref:DUF885 domain-containing protein n=1 Tax=Ekhidna sp. TaxID=2608089 RepID=UPI0032ED557F
MKKIFLILLCLPFFASSQGNETLQLIFNQLDSLDNAYRIENTIWWGQHPEKFTYQTVEKRIEKAEYQAKYLADLEAILEEQLTDQEQINRSIRILQLKDEISDIEYKTYLIPFNAEGGFFNSPSFFLSRLPFNDEDIEDYIRWLPSFSEYISYNQNLLRMGMKEKIQAPKVIVQNIIALLEPWTSDDIASNPFFMAINNESVSADNKEKVKNTIKTKVLPSYQALLRFLNEKYLPSSPEKVGISEIKNGRAYYEDRIRHFTTLDISPDSVYNIGLAEVSRIRSLMDEIIQEVEFKGDFAAFLNFLRTDPQFYPKTGQELLNKAAWLSKKAEGQLPKLFSKLYTLPFTVEPVPDDIAPKYTGGRYVGGSRSQNKAGIYWVNTYDLKSRTLYTLPALTLHEAVPGHHLQITLASELEGLPDFRSGYYISAFGEGWGLYAEYLGEEMGMYETPYDLFGRYTYEMWRACRLVVDVGLHYKGWTRQEAVDYMAKNTALSLHEVNTEIDRYIGWPGQAVSYKIGELTIKRLREKATKELGNRFDIQKFHEEILKNGSVPLPILIAQIEKYISAEKAK